MNKRKSKTNKRKSKTTVTTFDTSPGGVQLHIGFLEDEPIFNSDDGGKTWWSGRFLTGIPRDSLRMLCFTTIEGLARTQ